MKFSSNIEINRPVKEVYRFTVSPKNLSRWVDGFESFNPKKGRNRGKGSTATHIYRDSAGKLEVHEEVLDIKPEKYFKTHLSHKNMETDLEFKFLNLGDSTRVVTDTYVRLKPAIFNLFSFFMKGQMKKQQLADLRRLKNEVEGDN
jgi:uncharacterized protein YndB with AHSA1/START domain